MKDLVIKDLQLFARVAALGSLPGVARDGIDIAIRTATLLPDTVIARQIGTLGRALYATPGYSRAA